MTLTEINFFALEKLVFNFEKANFGAKPNFVIVSSQTYHMVLHEFCCRYLFMPPRENGKIVFRVRGVEVISSREFEDNQIEVVASSFRPS